MREIVVATNEEIVRISSREVAEMMEVKRHGDMLAKIDKINEVLTNGKIRSLDYWVESIYTDAKGETRREYLVSKKGCEMLAHKSTGDKGILFTVKYMEKFEQMEEQLKNQVPQISEKEQMLLKLFSNDPVEVATAHKRIVEIEVEEATTPLVEKIEEQKPDVEFATRVQENNEKTYSMSEAAKLLKLPFGNKTLFAKLRFMDILRGNNEPYQTYIDRGYFILKITDTGYKMVSTTRVTGKGLRWLEKKVDELTN